MDFFSPQRPIHLTEIYKFSQSPSRFLQSFGIPQLGVFVFLSYPCAMTSPVGGAGRHFLQAQRAGKPINSAHSKMTGPRPTAKIAIAERLLRASENPANAALRNCTAMPSAGAGT